MNFAACQEKFNKKVVLVPHSYSGTVQKERERQRDGERKGSLKRNVQVNVHQLSNIYL